MTANKNEETKVTFEMGTGSQGVEVARNIAAGTIPSNDIMLDSINSAQTTIDQRGQRMNEQGQTLAKDTQNVLEATKNLINEKNSDGKLQEVLEQTKNAAATGAQAGQKSSAQTQAGVVGSDLTQAARELATLLGQSTEMRGLLLEQFQTLRKLFWKRMQSKEGASQPSAYPSNTTDAYTGGAHAGTYTGGYTGAYTGGYTGGYTSGYPGEYSFPSSGTQQPFQQQQQQPLAQQTLQQQSLQQQPFQQQSLQQQPFQQQQQQPLAQQTLQQQSLQQQPFQQQSLQQQPFQQQQVNYISQDSGLQQSNRPTLEITSTGFASTPITPVQQQFGTTTPSTPTTIGATTPALVNPSSNNFVDTSNRTFGSNTQNISNTTNTGDHFQKIVLTPEEKRELVNSWRILLTRLGSKQNYGTAMNQIFVLFDHLADLKDTTASDPAAKEAGKQGENALYGVKELAERFMGDKTLDNLIRLFRELNDFTNRNPELRQFGNDWRSFATETIKEPKLLNDSKYSTRMEELVDRTVHWMNDRYFRDQSRAIADEIKDLFNAVKEDPALSEVQDSFSKLFKDLAMDQSGAFSISQLTSSLPQLKNLLAPIMIEQFNSIPINRVYGSTPKYDFELSNIILKASDLVPDKFFFDVHTKAKVGLSSDVTDHTATRLKLKVSNITASMTNVNFYYLRKKMPKIEDEGVVNIAVLEPGASIKIVWEITTSEKRPFTLKFRHASCDIGKLQVDIVEAKHSLLDKIATKLFAGQIKQRIETAVSDGLSNIGNGLADRMNRAVRHKPQPKADVKVGVDPKNASATISNTQNTTPTPVGSDKLY
eukprot:TRINITY_DN248_c0_g1_i2.p1 TRINITY_DN248_c0_g1~~TRINITY_DN248_c0_g1_i2.p1  ORF type:complete len:838 (-),score=334.75 TRINITY_DN248_c0_g1_i2:216-2678(-)